MPVDGGGDMTGHRSVSASWPASHFGRRPAKFILCVRLPVCEVGNCHGQPPWCALYPHAAVCESQLVQ